MIDFAALEARLTPLERAVIAHSPVTQRPEPEAESAFLPAVAQEARYAAHQVIPRLRGELGKGLDLRLRPEAFGLALAEAELRHRTVVGWPGFALLMRKLMGEAIVPWLPALFLAAVALPDAEAPAFDLAEVLGFGRR